MAAASKQTTQSKRKPRQPAIGQGWRTTDADEVERRRRRAATQAPQVQAENSRAFYGVYSVQSAFGGSHRVEFRSADRPINSCDCPDYEVNGLGTCKHIEAVRQHLAGRGTPARRHVTEIHIDRSDQYGQGPTVRVLWADRLSTDDPVRQAVQPFFGADDALLGESLDAIPALQRRLRASELDPKRVRLSAHITPWLERLQRRQRLHTDRKHLLADVAAGKRTLDVVKHPLYDYQQEGMLHLAFNGRAILADDMGLGKTVQAVAACELLRRLGRVERVLVVSPVSLKTEWEEQIARFTDLSARVIYGSRKQRLQHYREPVFFNLANYEQILQDGADIQRLLAPDVIILDEAQRIKNWQTKTADAVKRLSSSYVFVLTGTPLENRIDEVYSIAQVVDPHLFGPLFRFNREYHELDENGRPVGYKNLDAMHRRLRPVLLRRRKTDVEGELPQRTVNTYFVAMHPQQSERYDSYKADVAQLMHKAQRRPLSPEEFQRLQQMLACMRMLCDTPYILDQDCRVSPKLDELSRILDDQLADSDNKIVIFSEWTRMLDLVREHVDKIGIGYALHTGKVPQQRRRGELNRFKQEADCRLLLTSDAGATGLNLQAANIVINLDLPWNPAKLEQRIARAWRKHQKRHVTVINLVCEDSIEHRILHLLEQKRALAEGVLDGTGKSEMELPSGRKMLIERLESIMNTRLAAQPAAEALEPPAPRLPDLPGELEARHPQGLETMAVYETGGERQTLFAVVDGDTDTRRGELEIAAAGTRERPAVEVVDRATMATIQRLIEAGVLSMNAAQQTLHGAPAQPARRNNDERQKRIKRARERLAGAERKLGMARVLVDGGYEQDAFGPMAEALEEALCALADAHNIKLSAPIPLSGIRTQLAPKAELGDDTLALLAILREDAALAPPGALEDIAPAIERIGAAIECHGLE